MPANTSPRFTISANISGVKLTAANTKSDGAGTIGTDIFLVFTPGANGSLLEFVNIMQQATASPTTTNATVIRFYLSSQSSGATTDANTHLIREVSVPQITTADSSTVANNPIVEPFNIDVPTGMYLLASTHAAPAANSSYKLVAKGGDY